jgi:hypothetical protein
MAPRIGFALVVAAIALRAVAFAGNPEPTEIVPEAVPAESPSLYVTLGFGPGSGSETARFDSRPPMFAFTAGGSIPIKGKAYVDIGMFLGIEAYNDRAPAGYYGSDDLFLTTFGLTASGRVGHVGRTVAVYASAGVGFAYVRLGAPGGYGVYPEPVGSTMAPVLTVAGSLETHPRQRSRFLAELRYSWIDADLGSGFGGSANVGGPMLLFGWKYVF